MTNDVNILLKQTNKTRNKENNMYDRRSYRIEEIP